MNNFKTDLLEDNEVIAILVGFIVGVSILGLPNAVTKIGKQDGWISVIVGSVYPIIISLLAVYCSKKHPNEDILKLSRKYLGNILGMICNILFLSQFIIYIIQVATGFSNVMRTYATPFLIPFKIFVVSAIVVVFLVNKGLKIIGRINLLVLYFTIILSCILITALNKGNYLNIMPLFGTGYKNILKASIESATAFGGMEAIFLIYPFMKNKNKVKKVTLSATVICTLIYSWVTFLSIYFLGYKLIGKTLWSVLLLTESIDLPILNSFRYVFLFLWIIIILRCLSNEYYAVMYILKDTFKIKKVFKIHFTFIPIIIILCIQIQNEVERRSLTNILIPKITLFNIFYIGSICILIFIKNIKRNK